MQEIFLTVLEKDALAKGLATARVRLKAGRIIWDELDEKLPRVTGREYADADRLLAFKSMVEARPYYEKRALKEWLQAQIDGGYPDVLDGDDEVGQQLQVYEEHLKSISEPQF